MVTMASVTALVKGMLREYIDEHGVAGLVPKRKLPLTNAIITAMLAVHDGAVRDGLMVDRTSHYWIAMFAVFSVLAESGERKDEVPRFTFADLTWKVGGARYKILTPALRAAMRTGDGVYYAHGVSKNDPVGAYFAATPTFLPWRASGRCACRALADLEAAAAVPMARRGSTPQAARVGLDEATSREARPRALRYRLQPTNSRSVSTLRPSRAKLNGPSPPPRAGSPRAAASPPRP